MPEPKEALTDFELFLAELDAEIKAFLQCYDMTESRFGREVANNTELLPRLRRGQSSIKSLIKISRYMKGYDGGLRRLTGRARELAILKAVEELGLLEDI